jgi:hypothetical protein
VCFAYFGQLCSDAGSRRHLYNGKIFTSNPKQWVEAIAVRGDRILPVGPLETLPPKGAQTHIVDLEDRTMVRLGSTMPTGINSCEPE